MPVAAVAAKINFVRRSSVLLAWLVPCLIFSTVAPAWTRPAAPSDFSVPKSPSARLDYVMVEVNGEAKLVRDGEELAVVKGDRVMVREATLRDRKAKIRDVNVVGFQNGKSNDDRGRAFDSAKDLKIKYSESGLGVVYAIVAESKGIQHGAVYLRVIEPALRFAELSINGTTRTLRDGEALVVRGTDKVKMEKFVTNLDTLGGVFFRMTALDAARGQYEIRFLRGDAAFATIPLTVLGAGGAGDAANARKSSQ